MSSAVTVEARPGSGTPVPAPAAGSRRRGKRPSADLTPRQMLIRGATNMVLVIVAGFLLHLLLFSHLQHLVVQQQLRGLFTTQLAEGTAPVSEGNFDNVLLLDGEPVARLEIPAIGVDEVVVEGTSSGTLMSGPGHRRDTSLPGQAGVSVIMGRANAYGGPFNRLEELVPGDTISVITGQGEAIYEVTGLRYAGDFKPPPPLPGQGQMVLTTGRGMPYRPTGVVRVDSRLLTPALPKGQRDTTFRSLDRKDKELSGDSSSAWALFLALQLLIVAEAAMIYSRRRMGDRKTWVVFAPVLLLCGLFVAEQVVRLMPNLL